MTSATFNVPAKLSIEADALAEKVVLRPVPRAFVALATSPFSYLLLQHPLWLSMLPLLHQPSNQLDVALARRTESGFLSLQHACFYG